MSNLMIKDGYKENESRKLGSGKKPDNVGKSKKFKWQKMFAAILLPIVLVALLFVNVILVKATADKAAISASEAYHATLNSTSDDVYNAFYEKAYQNAEAKHHVSNDVSIVIENVKEVGKLEVLQVYDQVVEIWGDDENESQEKLKSFGIEENITSWLRISASGVFTIDLEYSEFITNESQQYVLVRVPNPVLSEFQLDENVEQILFESSLELGEKLDFSSAGNGEKVVRIQRGNAERKMEEAIMNKQDLLISAKNSAETIITTLVKQLNPHLPDLIVEVEFFD